MIFQLHMHTHDECSVIFFNANIYLYYSITSRLNWYELISYRLTPFVWKFHHFEVYYRMKCTQQESESDVDTLFLSSALMPEHMNRIKASQSMCTNLTELFAKYYIIIQTMLKMANRDRERSKATTKNMRISLWKWKNGKFTRKCTCYSILLAFECVLLANWLYLLFYWRTLAIQSNVRCISLTTHAANSSNVYNQTRLSNTQRNGYYFTTNVPPSDTYTYISLYNVGEWLITWWYTHNKLVISTNKQLNWPPRNQNIR